MGIAIIVVVIIVVICVNISNISCYYINLFVFTGQDD